jgi:hypothetical protein
VNKSELKEFEKSLQEHSDEMTFSKEKSEEFLAKDWCNNPNWKTKQEL